jgi:hypothetical protein
MSTTTEPTAFELPDGAHSVFGVEYLARSRGFRGEELPDTLIFGAAAGFSEPVAFVRTSKGDGYYLVRRDQCSCPSYQFRGGVCKHMRAVAGDLERKIRIDERNRRRAAERARPPTPSTRIGFNLPPGDDFPVKLAVAPL